MVTSGFTSDAASRCSRAASRSGGSARWTSRRSSSTSACTSSRSPTCGRMDFVQVLTRGGTRADGRGGAVSSPGQRSCASGSLLLLAVVLQLSAFGQIGILGGTSDIVVLVVAAVALYARQRPRRAHRLRRRLPARPAERREHGRLVARADRRGLRRRPLPRGARPGPRADADPGRCGRHRRPRYWLSPRCRSCSTWGRTVSPLVVREMLVTVLLERADRAAGVRGCRGCCGRCWWSSRSRCARRRDPPR